MVFAATNPGNATLAAILGYGVVLLALAVIVLALLSVIKSSKARKAAKAEVPAAASVETVAAPGALAPGAAGELKLHDVPPKTAAMAMAIVADKMGKPLNELRFLSIKEVK